ncbi:putative beta-farnesene synthase [Helianthus annuus]|nr:putative beta-farnesene synthase [Helianthus annuus]
MTHMITMELMMNSRSLLMLFKGTHLNHHQEMEESLEKEGKTYQIHYVIEMAKEVIENNLVEAKWLKEGYMPTLEEYMSVSMKTCTYGLMITRSFVGRVDHKVTEDTFKWVATYPPIVKAACLVLRLMDDITTHKVLNTHIYTYIAKE